MSPGPCSRAAVPLTMTDPTQAATALAAFQNALAAAHHAVTSAALEGRADPCRPGRASCPREKLRLTCVSGVSAALSGHPSRQFSDPAAGGHPENFQGSYMRFLFATPRCPPLPRENQPEDRRQVTCWRFSQTLARAQPGLHRRTRVWWFQLPICLQNLLRQARWASCHPARFSPPDNIYMEDLACGFQGAIICLLLRAPSPREWRDRLSH